MKMPQLFIKIGADRYIPVDKPVPNTEMYIWDDDLKQIVPEKSLKGSTPKDSTS